MQQLTNFGTTPLNGAHNNSTTSIAVTDGSIYPATGDFTIKIDDELMAVSARSTNTLTVTRGAEGTTAASHADQSLVKLVLSKAAFESYFAERIQIGGYSSRPATPRAGTVYYADDINLAWQYGTNWNLIHPVYVPYANRVDLSGWSNTNLGSTTWTDTNGVLTVTAVPTSGDSHRIYYKNLPSAPYKLNCIIQSVSVGAGFTGSGIGLYDGTKLHTLLNFNNNTIQSMSVDTYNSVTSFSANQVRLQHWSSPIWLQIEDDNTNWKWKISFDGVNYLQLYSETRNTFLTANKVCIDVDRTETTVSGDEFYQFLGYWEN